MKFWMLAMSMVCVVFAVGFALSIFGQELEQVQLPEPKLDPSKSLAQALKERKTSRAYGSGNLSPLSLTLHTKGPQSDHEDLRDQGMEAPR